MNETMDYITTMIVEHFEYIEREYVLLSEQIFEEEYGEEMQAMYGWTLPEYGAFCVERIARQTSHLDPQDLEDYLRAMLWIIDRHVVVEFQRPDMLELDRHHLIESELYDMAPDSMALLSSVELKALDDA